MKICKNCFKKSLVFYRNMHLNRNNSIKINPLSWLYRGKKYWLSWICRGKSIDFALFSTSFLHFFPQAHLTIEICELGINTYTRIYYKATLLNTCKLRTAILKHISSNNCLGSKQLQATLIGKRYKRFKIDRMYNGMARFNALFGFYRL